MAKKQNLIHFKRFSPTNNLIVLNDGAATHFTTHQTFTHVDICMCSAILAPKLSSSTFDLLHGSDHFPILTRLGTNGSNNGTPQTKFILDRANWPKFTEKTDFFLSQHQISSNVCK